VNYFAYGSNIDPRLMDEASPGAVAKGHGRLNDYRLEFNVYSERWGGGAANIVPDEEAHVWGVVWDVPDDEMSNLDTFVGHPTFYRQEQVVVQLVADDAIVDCVTYRVAHMKGYVRPTDEYLNRMRAAMRQQGLPPEALDVLDRAANPPYPRIGT
jgi:gamma-glutamylcyclotransferase